MQLIKVKDKKTKREFLDTAREIYKKDPVWVCPLDNQIEEIFNPSQNVFFKNGEAARWVLKDNNNRLIGRIAAFINRNKAYGFKQPTGGMGFFECINDKEAAFILFETAKLWLQERGMEAMDGPVNFGENDNFWGLLVEGFTHPGLGMPYNPPYYKDLFEAYGFKFYFEQISNHLDLTKPFPERFWKIADWVRQKPGFTFEHFKFEKSDKYISDFLDIYTNAWEFHENFVPINVEDLKRKLADSKSFFVPDFIWFAYFENEPIAFIIIFPDVNQAIKPLNGKMNLWNKIKFYRLIKKKIITRARVVIMGVKPKYQRSGIESGIFWHLNEAMKNHPEYNELELSWVGDFNPKMRALHEATGATFAKKHITYRKLFNENLEFHRSIIIPVDTKEKIVKRNNIK
ncbi:MAG: GNAT family N-acetyltransferase [Bacteroidales bacterium]|nr:GNAT family N-acetyltransferase [Bacteroidales bacterium]